MIQIHLIDNNWALFINKILFIKEQFPQKNCKYNLLNFFILLSLAMFEIQRNKYKSMYNKTFKLTYFISIYIFGHIHDDSKNLLIAKNNLVHELIIL